MLQVLRKDEEIKRLNEELSKERKDRKSELDELTSRVGLLLQVPSIRTRLKD
jgi:hypothetical protein